MSGEKDTMPLLHWLTRDTDIHAATSTPYRLLEEAREFSFGKRDTPNMLIQGDNLDALKALLPYYAGKVKCIFIDPPYNTRSAFEHYDDNLEHTKWLAMIYPRLELLRELLAEDGSIWVTIDDNEAHYLKVIMDEIFGRKNYLGDLIWRKRKGGGNDSHFFAKDHDYVIGFAKNSDKKIHSNKWRISQSEKYLKRYKECDEEGYRYYWDTLARDGLQNPIVVNIECPDHTWITLNSQKSESTIQKELQSGSIKFAKGKNGWTLHHRVYMPNGQVLRSILDQVGTNKDSNDEVAAIFHNSESFDYPKPETLIKAILELCTKQNDLVLDSFLGSGTTAAVAHKMGRQYIGIEMGNHAMTHCVPRLQKVIEGEQGGISEAVGWQGGGGFRFYRLGVPVFDENGHVAKDILFAPLAAHLWFLETGIPYSGSADSPFLGSHEGVGYYLLYNGILGDKRPNGGNILTTKILSGLPPHKGPKIMFGEGCRLNEERLGTEEIMFRQIPYDIKVR